MPTRQAKSIKLIRQERRQAGLCADCGSPSKSYRCSKCRPRKFSTISAARKAAVSVRWSKKSSR